MKREIKNTEAWLKNFIIKYNICPFAKFPYEKNILKITSTDAYHEDDILENFIDEISLLELNLPHELSTTLFVIKNFKGSFLDFNNFSNYCDYFLKKNKLDRTFKVVVFHPQFYFEGETESDISNLVNRSPYPMLHLIRTSDLNYAIKNNKHVFEIPQRNKELIYNLKDHELKKILKLVASGAQ